MIDFDRMPRFKPQAMEIWGLIDSWADCYGVPREAIIRQMAWAHAWCEANKKKAPKRDYVRFLFNWMAQAKRYGNLNTEKRREARTPRPESESDMTVEEMIAIRKANLR